MFGLSNTVTLTTVSRSTTITQIHGLREDLEVEADSKTRRRVLGSPTDISLGWEVVPAVSMPG